MSASTKVRSIAALFFAATVVHLHGQATFQVGTRNEEIPENGVVAYTVVKTTRNEFSFLPPHQWRVETDAKAGTLSWTSPDYRSMIQLLLPKAGSDETPKLKAEELRGTITSQPAPATITGEFPCYTSGLSGLAFDAVRRVDGKIEVSTRTAFVPVSGGIVQITLTAPKEQFTARQMDLSRYLNSFKVTKLAIQ